MTIRRDPGPLVTARGRLQQLRGLVATLPGGAAGVQAAVDAADRTLGEIERLAADVARRPRPRDLERIVELERRFTEQAGRVTAAVADLQQAETTSTETRP